MHVFIHCLIALLTAGLLTQLAMSMMPVGTPRQVVLICIAAGAGFFCMSRLAQARPALPNNSTAPRTPFESLGT